MNAAEAAPKLLYALPETARRLSIGKSKLYDEINTGRLRSVHLGGRHLVPADALTEYLERLRRESEQVPA